MYIYSSWYSGSFKASVSLMIFCLDALVTYVNEVLMPPTIIGLLSVSPFRSVNICFMYLGASTLVYIYLQLLFLLLDGSLDHYAMSFFVSWYNYYFNVYFVWYKHYFTMAFFLFPYAWNIFFHPLTFSLCLSLDMKWAFMWVLLLNSFSHSMSFDWNI